ncbi:hypothetical protein DSC71_23605 [Shigella boydii]|nr:hypothetical protein [Shigella boydii]
MTSAGNVNLRYNDCLNIVGQGQFNDVTQPFFWLHISSLTKKVSFFYSKLHLADYNVKNKFFTKI